MKTTILSIFVLLLTACATKSPTVIEYASDGTVIKMQSSMSGKQFARLESIKSAELARASCYSAQSTQTADSDLGRVALALANRGIDCGNGYNDVLIVREQGKTQRWQAGLSGVIGLAQWGAAGYLGGKALDGLTSFGNRAIANAGDRHTINNNGDQNQTTFGDNSPISQDNARGIPVNPTDIELSASNSEEPELQECTELGGTLREATSEEILQGLDLDGFVCSDGMGGLL